MTEIHPTAIIHPKAEIEAGARIGPYCIIEEDVFIGAGTALHAHVVIQKHTRIGKECQVHGGANLGGPPQDTKYQGERSYLAIGDHNIIREFVTIHRATGEGQETRIGNHNMLMANTHVGHNCYINDHVTLASYVGISGHVTIEDHANIGGMAGVHQYCSIGTLAMVGGLSGVVRDIPPYMLAEGRPAKVYDINKIGLRRAGISLKVRNELHEAYKMLYRSKMNMSQALEAIIENLEPSAELDYLLRFIRRSRDGKNGRGNA